MDANQPVRGTCRLIRMREVLNICGLSRATLYRVIKSNNFPAPVRLSARSVGWLQDEVTAWVESRIKARAEERNDSARRPNS